MSWRLVETDIMKDLLNGDAGDVEVTLDDVDVDDVKDRQNFLLL